MLKKIKIKDLLELLCKSLSVSKIEAETGVPIANIYNYRKGKTIPNWDVGIPIYNCAVKHLGIDTVLELGENDDIRH